MCKCARACVGVGVCVRAKEKRFWVQNQSVGLRVVSAQPQLVTRLLPEGDNVERGGGGGGGAT